MAGDYSKLNDKIGTPSFDIVLLSYVIQHIDPVFYPLVFDFCKCISQKFVAIDFWNPARIELGEYVKIGSINWYGFAFEELVTFIAPRFKVLGHRFHKTPLAVMINMLLTEGETRFESLLHHTYEYLAGPIEGDD